MSSGLGPIEMNLKYCNGRERTDNTARKEMDRAS